MRRALLLTALASAAVLPQTASAQEVTAGGSIAGRIGYGDNPYLALNSPGNTGVVGGTLTGWLQRRSATARTRLTGIASLDRNFQYYGTAENYLASIEHQQSLSARLSVNAQASYQDSINARNFFDPSGDQAINVDLLSIGQRTRTISASGNVQWTPTSRDSFYFGPRFSRTTYPNSLASDFNTYSLGGGYLRQINEKLKVGLDVAAQRVESRRFPNSDSYNAGIRLIYDLSAIWQFDGNVGVIHQTSSLGGSQTTLGGGGSLCGKYPRYRLCVNASRQSAASGFGGLRTDNRFGVSGDYDLSPHSNIRFGAVYDISESSGLSVIPTQKYWEISGGYSRTITDRLSAGFSGHYQSRDYGNLVGVTDSTVNGYSVTLDATYKFGRLE